MVSFRLSCWLVRHQVMLLSSQCLLKVLSVTISCYSFLAANDIFTRYLSCTNMSCNAAHIDCSRAVSSVTQILFLLLVLPPAGMTEWLQLYSNDLPAVPHFLQHRLFPIPPACTHFSSAVKWKGEKSDQILSELFWKRIVQSTYSTNLPLK